MVDVQRFKIKHAGFLIGPTFYIVAEVDHLGAYFALTSEKRQLNYLIPDKHGVLQEKEEILGPMKIGSYYKIIDTFKNLSKTKKDFFKPFLLERFLDIDKNWLIIQQV